MILSRLFPLLLIVAVLFGATKKSWALAGNLDSPSIACPVDSDGKADAVIEKVNASLQNARAEFAHGRFVNARTILQFNGATNQLNKLLDDLATIEGIEITVRFVSGQQADGRDEGASEFDFTSASARLLDSVYSIEHMAWSDPHQLTVTINLDADSIDVNELALPKIRR